MVAGMTKLLLLVVSTSISVSKGADYTFRLKHGQRYNEGIVQIYTDQGWGSVCDAGRGTWDKKAGDLVCRSLGFPGSILTVHGELSQVAQAPSDSKTVTESIDCENADSAQDCKIKFRNDCPVSDVVGLRCMVESASGCKYGEVAALGSCYRLVTEPKTFAEAQTECSALGSNLVEINDKTENMVLGHFAGYLAAGSAQFWTGGVISRILDTSYSFWHGSQKKIQWLNNLKPNLAENQREGLSFLPSEDKIPTWSGQDFNTRLPFICQSKQAELGCLGEEDPSGSEYEGPARRDEQGRLCIPWNTAGLGPLFEDMKDNFCRNPDGEFGPYCYVDESGEPSPCHIPSCGQIPYSSDSFQVCPTVDNHQESCPIEEWRCGDGSCIYKGFVCDGSPDCPGGDDERDCRRLTSFFVKEEGFSARQDEKTTFQASAEECARRCIYQKNGKAGSCNSFSHRPGKDGKPDKCSLGNSTDNGSFDTLVEKRSWNYYSMNATEKKRRGVSDTQQPVQGLRLRRIKKLRADLVEVMVGGVWGGLCDDGLTLTEADVICHQAGYRLGAEKVVSRAGTAKETLIVLSGLKCKGSEASVAQCSSEAKVSDCPKEEAVGVVCREADKVCEDDQFHCSSGECINIDNLCDGLSGRGHCKDGSDEDPLHCNARTQVRLVPIGESFNSGRLEIRHKGIWGTVCSDNFDANIANIFCRMLGYDGNSTFQEISTLEQKEGSWPIWLSLPQTSFCTGAEQSIEDCHDPELWNHDYSCSHHEDVQLTCTDDDMKVDFVSLDTPPRQRAQIDFESRQIVENCGYRNQAAVGGRGPDPRGEAVPRVAGGQSVPHGAIPWQASIRLRGPDGVTFHHCGAVIISPFHVLTTAHCLWDYRNKLDIYYVRVGDNVIEVEDTGEAEFTIDQVDFHENFNVGPYLNNDLAIAHINKDTGGINFGSTVGPVCLPSPNIQYTGLNVTISGWGKNGYDQNQKGNNFISKLQSASVPVIPSDVCRSDTVYGGEKISSGMFCAGLLQGGVDSCQGDSGGPAVVYDQQGRGVLVGVTSWGYGCGRINKPGVYTRLSKYVAWIYKTISQLHQ